MEAVPKWRALHEKYRKDGLRLVVVATQDAQSGCANPGWSPDEVVCDDDGFLSERFGAQNLPAAFLWSWQGNLLASKGHVGDIEQKIQRWIQRAPRVDVQIDRLASGANIRKSTLIDLVRARLRDDDKLTVLATERERAALRSIQARSMKERYNAAYQCEVGMELSANSLLKVSVTSGARKRLQLSLLSAERGCLIASSVVDWLPKKPTVSVAEATSDLLRKARSKTQYPWARSARTARSSYDALGAELKAIKEKEAKEQARLLRLERAWKTVKAYGQAQQISKDKRIRALRKFLSDFPQQNPFKPEAERMLASFMPRPTLKPKRPLFRAEAEAEARPSPSKDQDGDGFLDRDDLCPAEPEDKDGHKDNDGCPDPDNDGDGLLDHEDKCPNKPESMNGYEDEDGCPDKRPKVVVKSSEIQILDVLLFKQRGTKLTAAGRRILDAVAQTLKSNPSLRLRIEGHADSRELRSAKGRKRLSERRAEHIRALLRSRGVEARRLEARGYGDSLPRDDNKTPRGRQNNRRVEFKVL